ncbi:asparaginase [Rhizobium oryzihabitans]|uniref:Asparaginase n=1 Tax=Rhizobium oryzihabitans TaxID=2267833 RepID=A0A7L5BNA0_9HYPH|nr:asparaginase [Rhizobium oryzihabitans]QCM07344.1 asparaginase [Agrobacterium tumefaciens]QIB40349.1 asparaginase [Rhizobium oryzihabitans]CUX59124.1 putative L-asparaginase [Agrobacterium genomosp. 5 str. CFBP 6626]
MSGQGEAPLVAVIATGGTIASRRGIDGVSTPSLSGEDLLALVPQISARLKPVDLMAKDSSSLTLADMQRISDAVGVELGDPTVAGVVVLHGTDAMEESSLLVHLQHAITKPVVFTGAQFTADHPDADGPSNLARAIEIALDQTNAERGVLLSFGGRCLPAWGLYKLSADSADAFRSARPVAPAATLNLAAPVAGLRVDIVAIYPGCDVAHIEASLQAGADGIVLAALGSGNANPGIAVAVKRCAERRVPVVVSSRVPEGLLVASYGGGGGGHDLVAAGAVHSSTLRPGQARILLAALLANKSPAETIVSAFGESLSH